jgi:hypothetical protein
MESSLGADLSAVRVHQDSNAADAVNARAFTDGSDIVVSSPTDRADSSLLHHEAAHIAQAQQRGVGEGISQPNSASEREAHHAADALRAGEPAHLPAAGAPVPAIQRQEKPANPVVKREAVRLMLSLHYQEQGGAGAFKLTEAVKSELRRLIPTLEPVIIDRLWQPPPLGPMDAFQRLASAGFLPEYSTAEPEPQIVPPKDIAKPPPADKKKQAELSWKGPTGLGLHLTINPRPPAPIGAVIRQELGSRGLPLTHDEIDKILAGRPQGVKQIEDTLKTIIPNLPPDQRRKLAETIADALITQSVQGQLKRELPNAIERDEEAMQRIEQMLNLPKQAEGDMPGLLKKVPIGVSVTIYF